MNPLLCEIAALAVGRVIKATEITLTSEPAFRLIRWRGHQASPNASWGLCYFDSIAISIEKLRVKGIIKKAIIVDFDYHFGYGTANFSGRQHEIEYFSSRHRKSRSLHRRDFNIFDRKERKIRCARGAKFSEGLE